MASETYEIYWNEYSADTYLYGSEIIYNGKDNVEFKNMLMPPGTVIKEWYSKVNFQAKRIEPALPIIDGESAYEVSVDIDTPNSKGYIIRFVFYDKYEMEAGNFILNGDKASFRCPLKTYSYKMQLINGGMHEFTFHNVKITEIEQKSK
ncbi:MAG: accessory Sec system protein Asp3 [Lachnospiraceae bacterium]|nr:accessory Sec system protein Asp3 [Lachnospiraceae bacterium]